MKRGKFIEFLATVAEFSEKEKDLIFQHCHYHECDKGSSLLEYGKICTEVHFVLKGVIRFYILNDKGEELTTTFISEGEIATRTESFLREVPSNGYLHCETACELITIDKKSWILLCDETKNFGYAMGQIAALYISKKMEMQRRLLTDDAQSAYLNFCEMHETVANRVSMKHIASYLGITPSSLSRIKKEITKL